MRMVIQRVKSASVEVDGQPVGQIGQGLLVLLGIKEGDQAAQVPGLVNKLIHLRIFADEEGKMNKSVQDIGGEALVVSQFTLYANCERGRRPDFLATARPSISEPIYNQFVEEVRQKLGKVQTGIFGAYMQVQLINDGPATFLVES